MYNSKKRGKLSREIGYLYLESYIAMLYVTELILRI